MNATGSNHKQPSTPDIWQTMIASKPIHFTCGSHCQVEGCCNSVARQGMHISLVLEVDMSVD